MRDIGIKGVRRVNKVKTIWPDKALSYPLNRVKWQFRANKSWRKLGDFSHLVGVQVGVDCVDVIKISHQDQATA